MEDGKTQELIGLHLSYSIIDLSLPVCYYCTDLVIIDYVLIQIILGKAQMVRINWTEFAMEQRAVSYLNKILLVFVWISVTMLK